MRLTHLVSALSSVSLALAWTTYVVPHSEGYDDAPALIAVLAADPQLATNATIMFERGVTYNISTPIHFPRFENVIVSVQGNLTYAADVKATQGKNPIPRCDFPKLISGPTSGCCIFGTSCLLLSKTFRLIEHFISRRVTHDIGIFHPSSAKSNLTRCPQVRIHGRFQRHVGRFHGPALGLGEFLRTTGQE